MRVSWWIGILLLTCGVMTVLTERDFWCGEQTCYEALELQRTASLLDVRRSFKALSLK